MHFWINSFSSYWINYTCGRRVGTIRFQHLNNLLKFNQMALNYLFERIVIDSANNLFEHVRLSLYLVWISFASLVYFAIVNILQIFIYKFAIFWTFACIFWKYLGIKFNSLLCSTFRCESFGGMKLRWGSHWYFCYQLWYCRNGILTFRLFTVKIKKFSYLLDLLNSLAAHMRLREIAVHKLLIIKMSWENNLNHIFIIK